LILHSSFPIIARVMYDMSHQWGGTLPNTLLGEQTLRQIMIAVAVATAFMAVCGRAEAGFIVDISQVGANVVVNGSGSIDLSLLTGVGNGGTSGRVAGAFGQVIVGPVSSDGVFGGFTGPLSFGTSDNQFASSTSGDSFGLFASLNGFSEPVLYLPGTYSSGSALTGSATFDNTTIAQLGLNPGTYNYTATGSVGFGEPVITVNIGSVPEPSSITIAATALGLLGGMAFIRRRRIKG
jgi:PEP-CTERM motif